MTGFFYGANKMSVKHIDTKKFIRAGAAGVAFTDTSVLVTKESSVSIFQGDKEDIKLGFDPQDVKQKTNNAHNVFNLTFDTLGSGVAGTAPTGLDNFLKAAGGKETINVGTDVTYTKEPQQANIGAVDIESRAKEPITGKDYRYQTKNAKGTIGISFTENGYVEWKTGNFVGDYYKPDSIVAATLDYGNQKSNLALPANGETVLVYQVDGNNLCVSAMDIPVLWYGEAKRTSLPGGCVETDLAEGPIEGSFTMLETDWDADHNPYDKLDTGEEVPFLTTIGTEAGKQITISCPRVQKLDVQPATIGEFAAHQVNIRFLDPIVVKFH